ncbi:alcohol dehydrogenase catalytic domain-containing protein [candidate division KSB3 bacterium]|uniref:Alcohol dehydrogenase catalytic domain-containing protein n=1 Tax=candidate division KSB3 bacterium TaxID=2044937 RepID=A0A9D5Q5P6_9BACT|nr:alcohol dehydrogenase catalytic domain-containing protein [candidate division KSB3 bacterium]MBD3325049.1 alcohol dehydrogenase catalytic domain-containing protein [candidate division KSB3 bacterium]
MPTTMQAVVYHAPQDLRVETIPIPPCGTDEIRVKVDACAVCGSDLKAYKHGNPRITPPLVLGHEFTGLIDTVGANVQGFAPGERVVMAVVVSCGTCDYCRRGWPNICADLSVMGFGYPGGMAEYVILPPRAVHNGHVIKVPQSMQPAHAALAEPVGCVVNAMENCGIQVGDTVVVVGAGPMGIINACVAREFGAQKIILAEISDTRLQKAAQFEFHRVVNPAQEDLRQIVLDETDGLGADVVIVAAPAASPQEEALNLVRKRGAACLFASLPVGQNMLSLDSRKIHYGELRVVGTSDTTPKQVAQAVEMLAQQRIPAEKLATHLLPLDGIFTAFDLMQRGEALRVVLQP